jgi:hypothetical protein
MRHAGTPTNSIASIDCQIGFLYRNPNASSKYTHLYRRPLPFTPASLHQNLKMVKEQRKWDSPQRAVHFSLKVLLAPMLGVLNHDGKLGTYKLQTLNVDIKVRHALLRHSSPVHIHANWGTV